MRCSMGGAGRASEDGRCVETSALPPSPSSPGLPKPPWSQRRHMRPYQDVRQQIHHLLSLHMRKSLWLNSAIFLEFSSVISKELFLLQFNDKSKSWGLIWLLLFFPLFFIFRLPKPAFALMLVPCLPSISGDAVSVSGLNLHSLAW